MDLGQFFQNVEATMQARFREAGLVKHHGDRGENRESLLRDFLRDHLPRRYGVTKGEVITKSGQQSHSADIVIFDALACPVLYAGDTTVLPVEGVYGIIEVKSRLSKAEFVDASKKIERFKQLAPRDLSVISTREYVTVHRPSRPFGIALGFVLGDNSLDSLVGNVAERNIEIHDVNYFANLVVALGSGLIRLERVNLEEGEKTPLLDTDELVDLFLKAQGKSAAEAPLIRLVSEALAASTFGRFFVYLLVMLERMHLGVADLGQYLDPSLPLAIRRES